MAEHGDWVEAKPAGWRRTPEPDNLSYGSPPGVATLTGILAIVKGDLTGVERYSVNGITVDPTTIRLVPAHHA